MAVLPETWLFKREGKILYWWTASLEKARITPSPILIGGYTMTTKYWEKRVYILFKINSIVKPGFVQETRHKNQGLFKDFPAPNKIFPEPFVFFIYRDSNRAS